MSHFGKAKPGGGSAGSYKRGAETVTIHSLLPNAERGCPQGELPAGGGIIP